MCHWVWSILILRVVLSLVHFLGFFMLGLLLNILSKLLSEAVARLMSKATAWGTKSTWLLVVAKVTRFLAKLRAESLTLRRLWFVILLRKIGWI